MFSIVQCLYLFVNFTLEINRYKFRKEILTPYSLNLQNKYFWRYKDDAKVANNLALSGDREQLQHFCINQVSSWSPVLCVLVCSPTYFVEESGKTANMCIG